MDLLERIDVNIKSLEDPEGSIFDFDREIELLNELKKSIIEQNDERNIIEKNNKVIEELKSNAEVMEKENSTLEIRIKDLENELNSFRNLLLKEAVSRMRLLDYPEDKITNAVEKKGFLEICELREKVFNEFDMRFKIDQVVKDTPEKEILNYSLFKA